MSKDVMDKIWKVFTLVLGVVVVPLAGWVWNTNISLSYYWRRPIQSLETKIKEADGNTKAIISMEKDIEYMKTTLERIERFVTQ